MLSRPQVASVQPAAAACAGVAANMKRLFANSKLAAVRFPATVETPVTDGCVAYAAMKFTSDSWCRRPWPNSNQEAYGVSAEFFVCANSSRRAGFRPGMPAVRRGGILMAGRGSGRPTRVLRTDEVTNSSSSLPTCFERPLIRLPAACAAVSVPFNAELPFVGAASPGWKLYDSGLRN